MEFEEARIEIQNGKTKHIKLQDIENSKNLATLRTKLKCPTEGCNAKLSYVASKHPYLKTHNKSNHSTNCEHKKKGTKTRKRKSQRQISVALTPKQVSSRLNGFMDDFFPNRIKKTYHKRKNSLINNQRIKTVTKGQNNSIKGIAGNNTRTISKRKISSPRVKKKRLNQFIASDNGGIFQCPALLLKVCKNNSKNYCLKIKDMNGNVYGKLLLLNKFFSRNVSNINIYLDFLKDYINKNKNPNINIYIAFYGTLINYKTLEFEIFDDYGFKLYAEKNNKPKKYTLSEFYIDPPYQLNSKDKNGNNELVCNLLDLHISNNYMTHEKYINYRDRISY